MKMSSRILKNLQLLSFSKKKEDVMAFKAYQFIISSAKKNGVKPAWYEIMLGAGLTKNINTAFSNGHKLAIMMEIRKLIKRKPGIRSYEVFGLDYHSLDEIDEVISARRTRRT